MSDEAATLADDPVIRADALRFAVTSALADRLVLAKILGMTHGGRRDVYGVLGYDEVITAAQYRARYDRGGIAGRVVDALAKAVWRGEGSIFEDEDPEKETPFEAEWTAVNKQHRVWSTLARAHILASLGSYAILLIGAPGELNTELPQGKPGGILYLQPYGGGVVTSATQQRGAAEGVGAAVTIATWEERSTNERFGQPVLYQLPKSSIKSTGVAPTVHWSRVVHVPAIGFLDDAIYGPPALENVWNYLLDLDKVVGGGSEAFWLRANAGTHLNIDKKMALADAKNNLESLTEQVERYEHQMSRFIRTRGVDINQLGSDVADFKGPADSLVTLIAGTCGIPKRILTGSEMGELASSQDRDNWNDQVRDCRDAYACPVILTPFIERLIKFGYLTKPAQWEPEWPDISSMNEEEKLDAAGKMIALNDHGETVVTGAEVREFLGYEPLDDEQLDAAATEEEKQVDRLEAALRKGGPVEMVVKR